jgi:hypothetical protein
VDAVGVLVAVVRQVRAYRLLSKIIARPNISFIARDRAAPRLLGRDEAVVQLDELLPVAVMILTELDARRLGVVAVR